MAQGQDPVDETVDWDDSALVDSWNEALREYMKYHSIERNGGSLQDVEDQSPETPGDAISNQDLVNGRSKASKGIRIEQEETEEGEIVSAEHEVTKNASSTGADGLQPDSDPQDGQGLAEFQAPAAFPPEAALGSVQGENLKRLLMAWYYAGYYTALGEANKQEQ